MSDEDRGGAESRAGDDRNKQPEEWVTFSFQEFKVPRRRRRRKEPGNGTGTAERPPASESMRGQDSAGTKRPRQWGRCTALQAGCADAAPGPAPQINKLLRVSRTASVSQSLNKRRCGLFEASFRQLETADASAPGEEEGEASGAKESYCVSRKWEPTRGLCHSPQPAIEVERQAQPCFRDNYPAELNNEGQPLLARDHAIL